MHMTVLGSVDIAVAQMINRRVQFIKPRQLFFNIQTERICGADGVGKIKAETAAGIIRHIFYLFRRGSVHNAFDVFGFIRQVFDHNPRIAEQTKLPRRFFQIDPLPAAAGMNDDNFRVKQIGGPPHGIEDLCVTFKTFRITGIKVHGIVRRMNGHFQPGEFIAENVPVFRRRCRHHHQFNKHFPVVGTDKRRRLVDKRRIVLQIGGKQLKAVFAHFTFSL